MNMERPKGNQNCSDGIRVFYKMKRLEGKTFDETNEEECVQPSDWPSRFYDLFFQ